MYVEFSHVTTKTKGFSLQDISFFVPEGYITGIVGENGAGKTTLFRQIMAEDARYSGEIYIDGMSLRDHRQELMQEIGFISEEQKFFRNYNSLQNADFLRGFYHKFNRDLFKDKIAELKVSLGTKLSSLSRGEFLKFQLAFALAHGSRLFLLDEATAGMDVVYKKEFFKELHQIIEKEDAAILMSTHIQEEVTRHMDYVVYFSGGRVLFREEAGEWRR
ncbi:MAG: ABC transporter ATP-binding protein [Roseburia sp.]|nr:ABC transporter ATP-binding protein [Roseburia sp.]